jgi:putative endonuclease
MKPLLLHRQSLGKLGEDIATSHLQKEGYRIIQRNFKARYGEIDIICVKDNVLVFVEVKTRIGLAFGTPEEAVTPRKLQEVIKTAEYFVLSNKNLPSQLRIDVVAITLDSDRKVINFNHIQNVSL